MVGTNNTAVCQLSPNEATQSVSQTEAGKGVEAARAQTCQFSEYSEAQGTKGITASTNRLLTSMYRGVCWNRKNYRWQASLNNTGRYIYLGSYKTQEEAAAVFDKAALRVRGDRARLNFPRSNYIDASGNLLPEPELDKLLKDSQNPDVNPAKRAKTGCANKQSTTETLIIDDDDDLPRDAAAFTEATGYGNNNKANGVFHTVAQLQSSICNQSARGTAFPAVVLREDAVTMPEVGLLKADLMTTEQQCTGIADANGALHTNTVIDSATLSVPGVAAPRPTLINVQSHKALASTKINLDTLSAARNSNPSAPSSNNSSAMHTAQSGSAQPAFQIRPLPIKGTLHNGEVNPHFAAATVQKQGQPIQANCISLPMQISDPAGLQDTNKPLPLQLSDPVNKRIFVYHPTGPVEYSFLRADWQPNSATTSSQQSPDTMSALKPQAMDLTPRKAAGPCSSGKRASAGDGHKMTERGDAPVSRPALTTQAVLAQAAQHTQRRRTTGDAVHSQIEEGVMLLTTVSETRITPPQPVMPNSTTLAPGLINSHSEPLLHAQAASRQSESKANARPALRDEPGSMPLLRDILNKQKQQHAAMQQPASPFNPQKASLTNPQPSWSVVMQPQIVPQTQTMYITPASHAVHYSPILMTAEPSSADHVVPMVVPEVHTIMPHQVTYTAQNSPSVQAQARAHRPHSMEGSVSGLANWVSELVTVSSDAGYAGRHAVAAAPFTMPAAVSTATHPSVYGSMPMYMPVGQPVTILP